MFSQLHKSFIFFLTIELMMIMFYSSVHVIALHVHTDIGLATLFNLCGAFSNRQMH